MRVTPQRQYTNDDIPTNLESCIFTVGARSEAVAGESSNEYQVEAISFFIGTNQIGWVNNARNFLARKLDNRRSQLFYDHCKRSGHTMDKCYKLHPNRQGAGRGKNYRGVNNAWTKQDVQTKANLVPMLSGLNQEQSKQLLHFLTNLAIGEQKQSTSEDATSAMTMAGITRALNVVTPLCVLNQGIQILDNGVTEHMRSKQTYLHDLSLLNFPILASPPNRTQVKVTHKGKLKIAKALVLDDVLLVPKFKSNLRSIKRLCEQLHSRVQFIESVCILQAPSLKRQLAIGKDYKGLYTLDKEAIEKLKFQRQPMTTSHSAKGSCDV